MNNPLNLPHSYFLTAKKDIEAWLRDYGVEDYVLEPDLKYGFVVNTANVDLKNKGLDYLRVKFNTVSGEFCCQANRLVSLAGCPSRVNFGFWANSNCLETLQWGPVSVQGDYHVSHNNLQHFGWLPEKVSGKLFLYHNLALQEYQKTQNLVELKKYAKIAKEKDFLSEHIQAKMADQPTGYVKPFKL